MVLEAPAKLWKILMPTLHLHKLNQDLVGETQTSVLLLDLLGDSDGQERGLWTCSFSITWELVRNAESQASAVYTFTGSPVTGKHITM